MTQSPDLDRVFAAIYQAIDELNEQLPAQNRLTADPATVLLGDHGNLDSLGLVNLMATLEENLAGTLGRRVKVFDEALLADADGPLATVGSLANYIAGRL